MARQTIVAVIALLLGSAFVSTETAAGGKTRYVVVHRHLYYVVPRRLYYYDYHDVPSLTQSPNLLLPGFYPPWVPECFQSRGMRTASGWVRQQFWVCS